MAIYPALPAQRGDLARWPTAHITGADPAGRHHFEVAGLSRGVRGRVMRHTCLTPRRIPRWLDSLVRR